MNFKIPSKMPSMPSVPNVGLEKFSKSMSTAINSISNSTVNKNKNLAIIEQQKIDEVLTLLQDEITLQIPRSHLGFLTVYSSATLSPLYNKGISFKWFKMSGTNNDTLTCLDHSLRPFYSPTVDDINSKIYVQCQDTYDQGCAKFLETAPIAADPLVFAFVASIIEKKQYEIKDGQVTMGIKEKNTTSNKKDDNFINNEFIKCVAYNKLTSLSH